MNRRAFLQAMTALAVAMRARGGLADVAASAGAPLSEDDALGLILALPEFQVFASEVAAASAGTVPVHVRLEAQPDGSAAPGTPERLWHFAVAESHPTHLVTFFRFGVDPGTGAVWIDDGAGLVTVDEWRTAEAAVLLA